MKLNSKNSNYSYLKDSNIEIKEDDYGNIRINDHSTLLENPYSRISNSGFFKAYQNNDFDLESEINNLPTKSELNDAHVTIHHLHNQRKWLYKNQRINFNTYIQSASNQLRIIRAELEDSKVPSIKKSRLDTKKLKKNWSNLIETISLATACV